MKLRPGLALQSLLYVVSGANHFWHKGFYLHIMPTHYSQPGALVDLTGALEILGGVGLLVPATRRVSAVGLAALLVAFLDVHVFMLRNQARFPEAPRWILWARLPLQLVLIGWALYYARRRRVALAPLGADVPQLPQA